MTVVLYGTTRHMARCSLVLMFLLALCFKKLRQHTSASTVSKDCKGWRCSPSSGTYCRILALLHPPSMQEGLSGTAAWFEAVCDRFSSLGRGDGHLLPCISQQQRPRCELAQGEALCTRGDFFFSKKLNAWNHCEINLEEQRELF